MGKKRSWFSFVKRLFIPETKSKVEKKTKSWQWIFGGLKVKQYPEIAGPQKSLREATEEQRKHVLAVAIATAAAAEAAVAAANAAAEVVKLTSCPREFQRRRRNLAAIRIQSGYRRHLARKALSAMKGLVKLQAVIRGEIVRRKVIPKLRHMPTLTKAAPRLYQIRVPIVDIKHNDSEWWQTASLKNTTESQELNLHNRHKSWDFSLVSKEEMEALLLKKKEAAIKKEQMKKYSYSHRERRNDQTLQESIKKEHGRQSCRVNQLNEVENLERGDKDRSLSFTNSNNLAGDANRVKQLKLSNGGKQDSTEALNSPFSLPRRSFCHVKQKSIGDDTSLPNSPVFPTYMAATESAKAKVRSISTPKQRLMLSESYSGQHSPYKSRLSSWSSFNGEMTNTDRKNVISKPTYTEYRGQCWD